MIPPKVYSSRGWSQSFIGFSLALQVGSYGRAQACFFYFIRKHQTKITFHSKEWIFWWFIARKSVVFHGLFQFGILSASNNEASEPSVSPQRYWQGGGRWGWWWIQRASKTFAIFIFSFFWLLLEVSLLKEKVNRGHDFVNKKNNNSSNNSNKKREGKKHTTTAATITRRNHPFSAQLSHSPVKTHGRRGTRLTEIR